MESAALHHDCQVFCLDPWNEVLHERGNKSETEYIGETLVMLKGKARRYGQILIIAAHPVKINKGEQTRLYDISGSAHWRNKADHGVVLYRPRQDSNAVKVTIEKCKDLESMGVPGEKWLWFERVRCDCHEIPEPA
jgi:twinkle protein